MDQTPNLLLPYILAAQSQKHVTHNEALRALDNVVQLTVLDRNLAAPPATPAEGNRYIVAPSPTGTWAGHANHIAAFVDGAWLFYVPIEGWIAWIADENVALAFDGAAWVTLSGGVTAHGALTGLLNDDHTQYLTNGRGDARYTPLNPATLGINATADATNKLAVGSSASLFNHQGTGGHQIKINKALAADTASFLFQTGFSGRAELGTTGDDDFHFKVSANGTAFNEAIVINRTTGACTFPNTTIGNGTVTSVATGTGLSGGPITGSGTVSLANMSANTLKGNNTGAAAAPSDLTAAQVKTLLAISPADVTGLAAIATSGSASNLVAGTVPAAQMPAHTGDVTSTAGSLALTISANAVTNAKAAQMPANTLKGNNTGAAANAADLTVAQAKTLLAIASTDVSGLGALAAASSVNLTSQATGTLQAAQEPAHTGDVTNTAGSLALTIATNAVSNAKAAQMAANTLKGNNTGATANAADLTVAQAKSLLAIAATDVSGLGALATVGSVNLSTQATGTLLAAQEPAHTGDVTNSAGSLALTIAANAVTNAKAGQMAAATIKGNNTGAAANAADLTAAQVKGLLAIVPADVSGLGTLATQSGTFSGSSSGANTGDQTITLTGDVAGSGTGSFAAVIAANAVTNAKAAQMAANTLKGNNTGATANATDLTATQATALLDVVTASGATPKKGLVPAPPSTAGASLFLREDQSWALPPGAGGGLANAYVNVTDGTNTATSSASDTFKLRTGAGLSVAVTNNDPTHGDNALFAFANMAANTIKGNNTGAAAAPADLTGAQVAAILPFGSMERGLRSAPLYECDFMHANAVQNQFTWTAASAGTIAASATGVPVANHPGCVTITSSTTANSGQVISGNAVQMILGGGEQFDCIFKTGAAFTNTTMRLGFHDTVNSADAVDGAYFEVSTAGVVTGKTSNNSVRTASATITTLLVNTWYHARVKVNAGATAVDFTIFDDAGTSLGTVNINTNIPTGAGRECAPAFIATNAGTTATALVHLDYIAWGLQGRTLTRGALS